MPTRARGPMMRLSRPDTRLKFYLAELQAATSEEAREQIEHKIAAAQKQSAEPYRPTSRDYAILEFLARIVSATSDQIARHVGGSARGVRHRLKLMFRRGLVDRPKNQHATLASFSDEGNHNLVYGLARLGARLLAERGKPVNDKLDYTAKNARLMPLTLAHTISVTEAMMAFDAACASGQPRITLLDQHELPLPPLARSRFKNPFACRVKVPLDQLKDPLTITNVPDRVFSLLFPDEPRANYLLEVDRGTMDIKAKRLIGKSSYRKKQIGYLHFWKQGLHTERFAFNRFRLLTITTSEKRIASMLEAQREVTKNTASGLFLYSTPERIAQHGALGPAWISAERDHVSLLDTREDR